MTTDSLPAAWDEVDSDPDPTNDLGYEPIEMKVIKTNDGSGRLLFLPADEDMIADDAFIVASPSAVVDLSERS